MSKKRAVIVDLSTDARKFIAGNKQAEQAAKGLQDRIEDVGKALALAYTAKKVVDFAGNAVKAAVDDAAAQEVLRKAIEGATGSRAADMKSIESWVSKTQNATGVLDDELRPALATLVGATKDVGEAQKLMGTALDVARAKGVPLETVASALAKAYAGNTKALFQLVPGLKQAGEKTLEFADAKDRLNQMFSGTAAAWAETDAGKMARLNAQWSDMQETIGAALIPALSKVAGVVADVFGWFNSLDDGTKDLVVTIGLVGAGLYVAASAFVAVRTAVTALGISAGAVNPILAGIGVAVAGAVAVMSLFGDEESATTRLAKDLNDTLHAGAGAFDANKVAALDAADAVREYGGAATAEMDAKLQKSYLESDNLRKGLLALGLQIGDVTRLTHGEADAQAQAVAARRRAVQAGKVQVSTIAGMKASQEDLNAATERWIQTGIQMERVGVGVGLMWSDNGSQIFAVTNEMTKQNQAWAENITLAKEQALLGDKQAAAWLKATGNLEGLNVVERASVDATLAGADAAVTAGDVWRQFGKWAGTAADATDDLSASTSRAGEAARNGRQPMVNIGNTLEDIAGRFSFAADRASAFRQAIDLLTGGKADLQASNDALIAGQQELDGVIAAATDRTNKMTDAERAAALSLDASTEVGRTNREMFRSRKADIETNVAAMLAAGASTGDATRAMEFQRAVLVNQAQAFGLTKDQAENYVNQLGLTPDNIATIVKLLGTQAAEQQLANLARMRTTAIFVELRGPGAQLVGVKGRSGSVDYRAAATGGVFTSQQWGTWAEAGAEAILPLTDPRRMTEIVNDRRVLPAVLQALPAAGRNISGGGQFVFNQNAPVYGVDDLHSVLASWWRQVQRRELAGVR